jgi:hypothetical protein
MPVEVGANVALDEPRVMANPDWFELAALDEPVQRLLRNL